MADSSYTNRIVGHGAESPKDLSKMTHPLNWRVHPETQKHVLNDVLRDVGWVQQVVVNKTTNHLIDGHLRVALALEQKAKEVPVVYVELSEEEESLVLATLDPISAMAEMDAAKLRLLLDNVHTGSAAIQEMLSNLAGDIGIIPILPDEMPPRDTKLDSECLIEIRCNNKTLLAIQDTLDSWQAEYDDCTIDIS